MIQGNAFLLLWRIIASISWAFNRRVLVTSESNLTKPRVCGTIDNSKNKRTELTDDGESDMR